MNRMKSAVCSGQFAVRKGWFASVFVLVRGVGTRILLEVCSEQFAVCSLQFGGNGVKASKLVGGLGRHESFSAYGFSLVTMRTALRTTPNP